MSELLTFLNTSGGQAIAAGIGLLLLTVVAYIGKRMGIDEADLIRWRKALHELANDLHRMKDLAPVDWKVAADDLSSYVNLKNYEVETVIRNADAAAEFVKKDSTKKKLNRGARKFLKGLVADEISGRIGRQ